jgi:hypothetical protein
MITCMTTTAHQPPTGDVPDQDDLMELDELSERLGQHPETTRLKLKTGELDIPCFRVDRRLLFSRAVFTEWWDQRSRQPYKPQTKPTR